MAYSARALSTNLLQQQVVQNGHNFIVGDVLAFNGTDYYLAQADDQTDAETVGIVSYVLDVNNFYITQAGWVSDLAGPLTPGFLYYLSPTSGGGLTSTPPSVLGQYVVPLLIADSTTSGYYFNNAGTPVGDTSSLQNLVEDTNHGFAVGTILGWDGSTWFAAIANSNLNSQVVGMVSSVPDVNHFYITQTGFVTALPDSYTAGDQYYLSPTMAGTLTNVAPTTAGQYVVALFIPYTLHTGYFAVTPGVEVVGASGTFGWNEVLADTTMISNNGYYVNINSTLTLPSTSAIGDILEITIFNSTGFTIAQTGVSQQITGLGLSTSVGSAGSIVAIYAQTSIRMVCLVANTAWQILSSTANLQFN